MRKLAPQSQCQGLVLASYPFCEGCLSWSEDALAVASTSHLYIITEAKDTTDDGHSAPGRLNINDIRASLFNTKEWPQQELATISHLSLNEEQSESAVLAIDWSPAGVGIHRHSVLGVLTSNLLLSLWETDGAQQNWQRTLVVNHNLQDWGARSVAVDECRRRTRIRAFSWAHSLRLASTSKWGRQCLIFVDDGDTLYVAEVSKKGQHEFGGWNLSILTKCELPSRHTGITPTGYLSPLQSAIAQHASTSRLVTSPWLSDLDEPVSTDASVAFLYVRTWSAYSDEPTNMKISIGVANVGLSATVIRTGDETEICQIDWSVNPFVGPPVVYNLRDLHGWTEELRETVESYDRQNKLAGNYRIRVWGQADSPYSGRQALCVSLHPLDMYEYTSPVLEKCRLFIRSLPEIEIGQRSRRQQLPASDVSANVYKFLNSRLRSSMSQLDPLDARLLRLWIAYSDLQDLPSTDRYLLQEALNLAPSERGRDGAQTNFGADKSCESCEICDADIAMTLDRESARCAAGHLFSRCALSMLAIQEPGISKYCSSCNRQFLHLPKLGLSEGPSLMHALYDEFDVCPYCSGKFRG